MTSAIDLHVGKRLRRRRRLLGMTQQKLAEAVGIKFQQIQKYECGANRVMASRLYALAVALNVPIGHFFDGLQYSTEYKGSVTPANDEGDVLSQRETLDLIRAYYQIGAPLRQQLLALAQALQDDQLKATGT
ncbi:MAG: helix-turn-helix transcriptional regulator [Minisyncoccia bacterium]